MKLSVIVPMYNVEKYIVECLESISRQNFKEEFEIIIVNDGSTDSSLKKVNEYFSNLKNLKIISQENRGLSGARNTGMRIAQGEYIIFIDSDDFIKEDFCEKLYTYITKNKLDVVYSTYNLFFEDGKIVPYKGIYSENKIFTGKEARNGLLRKNTYRAEVCYGIYKKKFLEKHKIYFIEEIINEDEDFTLRVLLNANMIGYLNYRGYMYRQRDGSITKLKNYDKVINSRFKLIDSCIDMLENIKVDDVRNFILWRLDDLMKGFLIILRNAKNTPEIDIYKIDRYIELLRKEKKGIKSIKYYIGKKWLVNYYIINNISKNIIKKIYFKMVN